MPAAAAAGLDTAAASTAVIPAATVEESSKGPQRLSRLAFSKARQDMSMAHDRRQRLRSRSVHPRQLHRRMAPLLALPLLVTLLSGSLYGTLQGFGLEVPPWLLDWHTGRFGSVDLSPWYSLLLGLCTLTSLASGLLLWWWPGRRRQS